jgi:hypothetical protein
MHGHSIINVLVSNCVDAIFLHAIDVSIDILDKVLTSEYMYHHI